MKRGTIEHPKTLILARTLGIPQLYAVGVLESLWHWVARYAADGDLSRYDRYIVARGIMWDGDDVDLVGALIRSGWLDQTEDGRLLVHDWSEHADDAVHKALQRQNRLFADGNAPYSRREAAKVTTKARQGRDAKAPKARPCRDGVATPARLPEPEPEPVSRANGLGTSSGVPSVAETGRDDEYPTPSPEKQSGKYLIRNPASPPDGVPMDDWAVACDLASLIEAARIPGQLEGKGSVLRARALLSFAEIWPKRPFCRTPEDPWSEIVPALRDAIHEPRNGDLEALTALRRYPDGAYPADGSGRPSRLERLIRNWQERHPHREAGAFARAGVASGGRDP